MKIEDLEIKTGIMWTIIWMLLLFLVSKKSVTYIIQSSLIFFIFWIVISYFLIFICENFKLCIPNN